jgi:hypothetical protein
MVANPGPERLASILEQTVKQYHNKSEHTLNITRAAGNSRYLKDGGKAGLHWCGIFAVYCLRKATGDTTYHWDIYKSPRIRHGDSGVQCKFTKHIEEARVGDIGYLEKAAHHFVIVGIEPGKLHTVDGNSTDAGKYNVIKYNVRTKFDGYYNIFG